MLNMKTNFLFLLIAFLQSTLFCIQAQTNPQEGTWKLETANINLLDKGRSELIHTLTAQEIEEKAIPVIIEITNNQLFITTQHETIQSQFTIERGKAAQTLPDLNNQTSYISWISKEGEMILVAEYTVDDYAGNELRLIYKKQ